MGALLAHRRSECAADCGHYIQPGDFITQGETPTEWFHTECTDPDLQDFTELPDGGRIPEWEQPADWELKPGEKVCTGCWMVQPCDCESGNQ